MSTSDTLDELKRRVIELEARVRAAPTMRWATVVSVTPLSVVFDSAAIPIAGVPSATAGGLSVGDRVQVVVQAGRATVVGRAGGTHNKVLWSGGQYMSETQTATLSERVSNQATGIILVWRAYASGAPVNRDNVTTFVPKWHIATSAGGGFQCWMSPNVSSAIYAKYVYVYDDRVVGYTGNSTAPKSSHVLVAVIGV